MEERDTTDVIYLDSVRLHELVGRYFAARDRIPHLNEHIAGVERILESVRRPKSVQAIEQYNAYAFETRELSELAEQNQETAIEELVFAEETMAGCIHELLSGGMPTNVWIRYGSRAVALELGRIIEVPWRAVAQAPPAEPFRVTAEYGRLIDRWDSMSPAQRLSERPGTLSVLGIPAFFLGLAGLFTGILGFSILSGILTVLLVAVVVGEMFVGPREFLAFTGLPEVTVRNKDRKANR